MLIEVKVPQLPESVSEATLMSWHKKVGEFVSRDENLIDLETDKVVLELPAPQAGIIVKLIELDGTTVTSGQLIAQIDTEAKAGETAPAAAAAPAAAPAPSAASAAPGGAAMPSAAKLAAETGVNLAVVAGSGRDGRILKEDVAVAAAKPAAAPAQSGPVIAAAAPAAGVALASTPAVNVANLTSGRPEQRVP
ncbi:MAG: E3 binding domain-containing protein, partial [Pseudogulbenkiania sp.]|nr:E3 binding domain-containing protein [Pseudogulbenkiania sp.]